MDPKSRANGPGTRFTVWFQGCSLGCPDCFNPDTHPVEGGVALPVAELLARIEAGRREIDGVTISGGEPFDQPEALLSLVHALRRRTDLSVILFSGRTLEQVRRLPLGDAVLDSVDVLIDGPYRPAQQMTSGLRGSRNQQVRCFTDRHEPDELETTPPAELVIAPDGRITVSGIDPPKNGDTPLFQEKVPGLSRLR